MNVTRRTRISSGAVAATVLLALVSVACSGGYVGRPPLDVESIVDSTTDYQRAILDDGEVSPSEYEESLMAYRTCVADAGAVPSRIYDIGSNEKGFGYEVTAANQDEVDKINVAADECLSEYYSDVGRVWADQQLRPRSLPPVR